MTKKDGPWARYEPSAKDPWDLAKVAHLHRRAGFGATRAELLRDLQAGPQASVDRLLKPPPLTSEEQAVLDSLRQGVLESGDGERLKAWWLYRVLYDPDPLREKLTLFWHGHFATSNRKVRSIPLMLQQNELFRKHALGPFADLLTAVVGDPAMLIWLDGATSQKQKPNENFAREFLELFTLGVGHYTEKDIREAARAFTGWGRANSNRYRYGQAPTFTFDPAQFDEGSKTFLKQTGAWKAADIVRITLEQPTCAEFLCRKLYRFLVSEAQDPAADLLAPLAQEFRASRYSVQRVLEVILRSQHFYSRAALRQRIKGPVEFSAGLVRILEVPRGDVRLLALAVACDRQGQELFAPPNVKGWDGHRTWINSTTVLERGNWVSHLVWGNPELGMNPYDPLAWAQRYHVPAAKIVPALVELTLQGDVSAKAKQLIAQAAEGGKPDGVRKALQRMLHCPEFQLA
jgi:uncharacterized protein (DUF1800 family)